MAPGEAERVFGDYFTIFPWDQLPPDAEGFDMGCGSGRWARFVAPRVGRLHCIDPSSALAVARQPPGRSPNVQFQQASVAASALPPNSQAFGYFLGVRIFLPYWPIALVLVAAYALLPSLFAAALFLILLPLLAAVLYFRSVEAWLLRLMQRAAQRLQAS